MADKYSHWLGKLFGKINKQVNYAVTFWQTTYYSCTEFIVLSKPEWIKHENKHKEQWAKEPILFLPKYIWQNITVGYANNKYEIEARAAEKL